ncbi:phage portal protein [Lachnospiraceae bacterium LCP25S3_G4]
MSIFDSIRKKEKMEQKVNDYFKLMNAYIPRFTSFEGSIYEMELTRSAIHSFATHVSKLKPEVKGTGNKQLERMLQTKPNYLMDTKKYLYRLATVYMVDNTAFIAPLYDDCMEIEGFYPLSTKKTSIVDYEGNRYIRYDFGNGRHGSIEIEKVGIMNQFQYNDELFGDSNACLRPTMDLIHTQNQGIIEGVKNSASLRFMAKLAQTLKPKDIEEEKKNFMKSNLSAENNGGVLLFDTKYEDVKQIDSKPFVVNPIQMSQIKENVFNYFGTNENILQNKFNSDEWSAYYEGKIEPFAIEASLVHTNMKFNQRQVAFGNQIMFTANRSQYMSNTEKLQTVTQLFDRGFMTHNQGLEIFNMSPVENGDKRFIRREYIETNNLDDQENLVKNEVNNNEKGGEDNE